MFACLNIRWRVQLADSRIKFNHRDARVDKKRSSEEYGLSKYDLISPLLLVSIVLVHVLNPVSSVFPSHA